MTKRKYKSIDTLKTLGINNEYTTKGRDVNDYYGTPPVAVDWLLKYEKFSNIIYEPMCGGGAISERLKQHNYQVVSSDINSYGYKDMTIKDFTKTTGKFKGDIISNPPYKNSIEMTLQALKLTHRKVAFFMKIQFLETIQRHKQIFSKYPPSNIYIFTKRIACSKNGIYNPDNTAVCYCWVVWDKYNMENTYLHWIPNYKSAGGINYKNF